MHAQVSSEGFLATAIVDLVNTQGESKSCRVFLDTGSQANFITESVASFLKLNRKLVDISVSCVENISTEIKHSVSATLKSRFSKYSKNLEFLVLNRITKTMPSVEINRAALEIPKDIFLADPEFYKPSEIDALIGVKLFYKLLCVGQITLKNNPEAVLQKTQLGWIVAGEINSSLSKNHVQCSFVTHSTPLDSNLTKFWEIEEVPSIKLLSQEEQACESHFKNNTQRDPAGRYIVRLPFKENKDKDLAMPGFYLPHHAVIRADDITTKIRFVFNGSTKTSTGVSLNDSLMVGPKIQDDLFILLTRFRSHRFALTADIEKMYRQVLVHPDDASKNFVSPKSRRIWGKIDSPLKKSSGRTPRGTTLSHIGDK
ncbi:uncharacterized protein LOC117173695 [Belonocnema kinseyi]|uniref:uncharacterized protein LOC117173695 n=1 Tax=Belonocnema kinseyi TaxID=2817044 RepID=UPI00143D1C43|nr:uncharacterized protein LOC117173695 [Belonocnema kinseyi]